MNHFGTATNTKVTEAKHLKSGELKVDDDGIKNDKTSTDTREALTLKDELQAAGFTAFRPLDDLGYFGWEPNNFTPNDNENYQELQSVSVVDVQDKINVDGKPPKLLPLQEIKAKLPLKLAQLTSTVYDDKFPLGEIGIAALHVACRRGVKLSDVNFCLGGSTLKWLASQGIERDHHSRRNSSSNETIFVAMKVPGTNCIFLSNKTAKKRDSANVGFQFERLVTGGDVADTSLFHHSVEHLHTMQVGDHNVLFRAEVDAMDENGSPVEIKVTGIQDDSFYQNGVMCQMISSGSLTLCKGYKVEQTNVKRKRVIGGGKKKDTYATDVECFSLSDVISKTLTHDVYPGGAKTMEQTIVNALNSLRNHVIDQGILYKLNFSESGLIAEIVDVSKYRPLPPDSVVKSLTENNDK